MAGRVNGVKEPRLWRLLEGLRLGGWMLPFHAPVILITIFLLLIVYSVSLLALRGDTLSWDADRFYQALKISVLSSSLSATLAFALSVPIAYSLSRRLIPGEAVVETLTIIFLGLPPVGIGIAILAFFSSTMPGAFLDRAFGFIFSLKGIVLAQFLVVFPLVVKFVKEVIDVVPPEMEDVYQVMGGNRLHTMFAIVLPQSYRGLIGAWLIGWLRSLGEFGATVVVSGIVYGKTETLTTYMYTLLSSADIAGASRVMLVLITIATAGSILIHRLLKRLSTD